VLCPHATICPAFRAIEDLRPGIGHTTRAQDAARTRFYRGLRVIVLTGMSVAAKFKGLGQSREADRRQNSESMSALVIWHPRSAPYSEIRFTYKATNAEF
jgi:hypothetical protein